MDDSMLESVLNEMLGDTEKETDKSLFPPEDGHKVTITIEHGNAKKPEDFTKDDESEADGGYAELMKGVHNDHKAEFGE